MNEPTFLVAIRTRPTGTIKHIPDDVPASGTWAAAFLAELDAWIEEKVCQAFARGQIFEAENGSLSKRAGIKKLEEEPLEEAR